MTRKTSAESVEERLQRGIARKIAGEYPEAERELRAVLAAVPDHGIAHHELALVLGFTGDFDGSLAELSRAVELLPKEIKPRLDLAKTQCMLGEYEAAKQSFQAVLDADPENDEARNNLEFLADV